jgi:hypothetical protein
MRAYPKGIRVSSSNLDPAIFWRKGVQIVALNWQKWDAGTMLNEAMFAGTGGWILKPPGYRSSAPSENQAHAAPHGTLSLRIKVLAGQNIPLPLDEDDASGSSFKVYLKCELHIEKEEERRAEPIPGGARSKDGEVKQRTKVVKTQNPDFGGEELVFDDVRGVVPELSFVRYVRNTAVAVFCNLLCHSPFAC